MIFGLRSKLFLASVVLILVVGAGATLYMRYELRRALEARIQAELVTYATAARAAAETVPLLDRTISDALVRRIAEVGGVRIEVISADGHLLADSVADEPATGLLERPEVQAAQAGTIGIARRGGRLLVAEPLARDEGGGIVRVSASLEDVAKAHSRLYELVTIAGVIGLSVALVMTLIATRIVTLDLRRLAAAARDVARGDARRVAVHHDETGSEIASLGGSFNRMAEDIEHTVAALAKERSLLGSVLENLSQGVIALDEHRRITMLNQAAETLLGVSRDAKGQAFLDQVRAPSLVALVTTPYRAGTAEVTMASGLRVVARLVPASGQAGAIMAIDDVTSVRRLETIRRDFVDNVSHELRTPVSVIRANAEALLAGALRDPEAASKMLGGLSRNAERLSNIVGDLLDLSRIESGHFPVELEEIPLAPAIAKAIAAVESTAAAKPISITSQVAGELRAMADGQALDQILVNLLDNAVKYTQPGGAVTVKAGVRGERVRIEVCDNGPGIPPLQRERIFERFYRVDPGRSRDLGGTGLGLSIVRHLAEIQGGAVGVVENAPQGSVFWVELPAAGRHRAE